MHVQKGLWHQRMKTEIARLDAIGVWDDGHKSELPEEYEGPFHFVWSFDIRPNNIVKGLTEVLRPRLCVGRLAKDGTETTNDPLSKFATTTDFLSTPSASSVPSCLVFRSLSGVRAPCA